MSLHRHNPGTRCRICVTKGLEHLDNIEHSHSTLKLKPGASLELRDGEWYGGAPLPDGHVVSGRIEPGDPFNMGVTPAPQHPTSATEPARHAPLLMGVGIGPLAGVALLAVVFIVLLVGWFKVAL